MRSKTLDDSRSGMGDVWLKKKKKSSNLRTRGRFSKRPMTR